MVPKWCLAPFPFRRRKVCRTVTTRAEKKNFNGYDPGELAEKEKQVNKDEGLFDSNDERLDKWQDEQEGKNKKGN